MFSFHMDNTAYASHFSVQRDLWKRERRQKNYFKGNMLKKEKLVWGFVFWLVFFFFSGLIYFYMWWLLFLLLFIIILLVGKENFQELKPLML